MAEPADRTAMERVIDELVVGLRRRLGGPFTVQELADLYMDQGTDWCFDVAVRGGAGASGGVGPDDRRRRRLRPVRARGDRLHDRAPDPGGLTAVGGAAVVVAARPAGVRSRDRRGGRCARP